MSTVSILIPTYNRGEKLIRAIKSAQAQSYQDLQIIVSDNRSTDDTVADVQALIDKDPRIEFYQTEKNEGPLANWKFGLSKCTGEYIKILWSDDWLHPECCERGVKALQENSDVGFVFFRTLIVHESRDTLVYAEYGENQKLTEYEYLELVIDSIKVPASPGATMARMKMASFDLPKALNLSDDALTRMSKNGAGPDLFFIINNYQNYSFGMHLPKMMTYFEDHDSSITVTNLPEVRKGYQELVAGFIEYSQYFKKYPSKKLSLQFKLGKDNFKQARKRLKKKLFS